MWELFFFAQTSTQYTQIVYKTLDRFWRYIYVAFIEQIMLNDFLFLSSFFLCVKTHCFCYLYNTAHNIYEIKTKIGKKKKIYWSFSIFISGFSWKYWFCYYCICMWFTDFFLFFFLVGTFFFVFIYCYMCVMINCWFIWFFFRLQMTRQSML